MEKAPKEQAPAVNATEDIELVEGFSPKAELEKIKKLPKEERQAAVAEYKERLAVQKNGIAEMQGQLIADIRKNPDATKEDLYDTVNELAHRYKLDSSQRAITKTVLQKYLEKHKAVREIRAAHPDNKDLFRAVFGRPPQGDVEVIKGPMTLYFRCHDLRDYTFIATGAFLSKKEVTPEEMAVADGTSGIIIGNTLIKELQDAILVENAKGRSFDEQARKTYQHEEQHAINRLFKQERVRQTYLREIKLTESEERRELILKRYLRDMRANNLERAKGELLAHIKAGRHSSEEIFTRLTQLKEEGGAYDFFSANRSNQSDILMRVFGREKSDWIAHAVSDVFVSEYRELIKNGLDAFSRLEKNGFTKDQAVNILITEPLEKWSKTVERIVAPNKNGNV